MSTPLNIAIVGTGVVGSSFIKQLAGVQKHNPGKYNVVLIARLRGTVVSKDYTPIDLANWQNAKLEPAMSVEEIQQFLSASPVPVILVDNTSDESLALKYPSFLKKSISIATPNKKGFSSNLTLWNEIFNTAKSAKSTFVYHEATVGAGLPIIGTLNDMVKTGDNITKIEGILSGTLSYIFNEFSTVSGPAVKFSDVVAKAKSLGYTEPDPRDDLNGMDVARKVTILARLAGLQIESPTSFSVGSLIPKPLESVQSADEFMAKLPDFDAEMEELRKEAAAENKVLRFVGKVDLAGKGSASVGIEKYDKSHPFASLKGSDNVISFQSTRYTNPLIVQGAGAGADVTAAGVLADVLKIAERL